MSADLLPQSGARFELELIEEEGGAAGAGARYRARVHLPGGCAAYALQIGPGGECTLAEAPEDAGGGDRAEAPVWTVAHLVALGRLVYREAKREGAYRRRLLRWRSEC